MLEPKASKMQNHEVIDSAELWKAPELVDQICKQRAEGKGLQSQKLVKYAGISPWVGVPFFAHPHFRAT